MIPKIRRFELQGELFETDGLHIRYLGRTYAKLQQLFNDPNIIEGEAHVIVDVPLLEESHDSNRQRD